MSKFHVDADIFLVPLLDIKQYGCQDIEIYVFSNIWLLNVCEVKAFKKKLVEV